MTPEEGKYIVAYLDYYKKRNGKITNEDEKELAKLQDSLGLNFSRCWELIQKAQKGKISEAELEFASMQTKSLGTNEDDLQLSTVTLNEDDPYYSLIKEIDQYEEFATEVLSDFSVVSERVSEIKAEVFNIADILGNQGAKTFNKGDKRIGGAMMAIAGIAELGAYGWEKWQNYKNDQKLRRYLDELLAKKQEMANAKYNAIKQQKDRYSSELLPKFQKLYDREFMVSVSPNDNLLEKRIEMFKKSFVIVVKSQYLDQILSFVLSEMRAWKKGEQQSSATQPTIKGIVDKEVKTWFKKLQLRDSYKDMNDYLSHVIKKEQETLPLPIYYLFSEPHMLYKYIGVKFFKCSDGSEHIKDICYFTALEYYGLELDKPQICKSIQKILNNNPYYTQCRSTVDEVYNKGYHNISLKDCLILLLAFLASWIASYLSFEFIELWFDENMHIIGTICIVIYLGIMVYLYYKFMLWLPMFDKYDDHLNECIYKINNKVSELKSKYNKI